MADLRIVHMYPDLLRTYGDRGNVITLARRAEWRGLSVDVDAVSRGQALPKDCHIVFIGGGSDRVQAMIAGDLAPRRDELAERIASGLVVLGVCGGYQLLGSYYRAVDGSMLAGLGLIDVRTEAGSRRIIGRVRGRFEDSGAPMVGFENHAGRTFLGPSVSPLGRVKRGQGNNGKDRGEGAVSGSVFGTYLHGPVLPVNPAFADRLLDVALRGKDAE